MARTPGQIWRELWRSGSASDVPGEVLTPSARAAAALELDATLATLDVYELPSVVAGRQLIADTTAMLPIVEVVDGDTSHPIPSILRRPDPRVTYRSAMERIVNGMTRHGRSWLYVEQIGANGYPLSASYVDDTRVAAETDASGRVTTVAIDGQPVDRRRIVHIPMRTDRDPLGSTPLRDASVVLEQLSAAISYASAYYLTAHVPPYAVRHPSRLSAVQTRQLADEWLQARAERRVAFLSGGVEIDTFAQPSAGDALLLDAIAQLDAAVARILQIPPSLLNVASQTSLTYSNVTSELSRWLAVGLYPMILSRVEAAFSDLLPRGHSAVFDTSNLLRMDLPLRIATYSESLAAGIHTLSEIRALEGLPRVPETDPIPLDPNVTGL